jgi:hypothetical protein
LRIRDVGFEVGDARSWKRRFEPGRFQPLVLGAGVGGELAEALLECGVLGGDAVDGILSPFGFQVADVAL